MAFLGLKTADAGLGGGSVADVLIKALTGDPEREMALARGRSDLELDAYRQKQMEATAANQQAEADARAATLNQNIAAGSAAGDYYAGALPVPVDPDPSYTAGEPLPVSVDQTPTMADLYRGHPEEPVPVYLEGTDETDIVPYADQMANYDRQRAYEQERAKAVFMGGGNAAQVAQGANLLEGGYTQANETDPDALRRNMPLLGINPTDQTVLGDDDLAGTKSRIAVEAAKGEQWRPMTAEERQQYQVPEGTPARISSTGKAEIISAGGTNINLGEGKGKTKWEEAKATDVAGVLDEATKAGLAAVPKLAALDELETLLPQIDTGTTAQFTDYLTRNWGINLPGGDKLQAFNAIIKELTPQQRPEGSGTMSDNDVKLFAASLPSMLLTPQGNNEIMKRLRGMAEYNRKLGLIASKAYALDDPDDARAYFDAEGAKLGNPLAGFDSGQPGGSTGAAAPTTAPAPEIDPNNRAAYDALPAGAQYTVPGDPTVYTKGNR